MKRMRLGLVWGVLALATSVAACSDDSAALCTTAGVDDTCVGGPCFEQDQCQELCVVGDDFPGGMCSLSCGNDSMCASGTSCVDTPSDQGFLCLLDCTDASDCRDQYACESLDRAETSGQVQVCVGDFG